MSVTFVTSVVDVRVGEVVRGSGCNALGCEVLLQSRTPLHSFRHDGTLECFLSFSLEKTLYPKSNHPAAGFSDKGYLDITDLVTVMPAHLGTWDYEPPVPV